MYYFWREVSLKNIDLNAYNRPVLGEIFWRWKEPRVVRYSNILYLLWGFGYSPLPTESVNPLSRDKKIAQTVFFHRPLLLFLHNEDWLSKTLWTCMAYYKPKQVISAERKETHPSVLCDYETDWNTIENSVHFRESSFSLMIDRNYKACKYFIFVLF